MTGRNRSGFSQGESRCPECGKIRYQSRKDARQAQRTRAAIHGPTGKMRAYKCGNFWHLTSRPADWITGYRESHAGSAMERG
jgi:ssDNA-binding Zn-finger/Zn-ribbon topoisomerase 1